MDMNKNFLSGSKQVKDNIKTINAFAIPLMIQFITNYIISLTDQAIIGRISTEAFAAIGIVNSFQYMLVGILGSVTIIFNIRGSRKIAEGDNEGFVHEFKSSVYLGIIIGLISFLILNLFKNMILNKLYGFSGQALKEGLDYFTFMSPYILIQMLIFTFGQYYKIHNKTKWLLIGSLSSSIINLVLDYLFVLGSFGLPRFGVKAAAISTIIAMIINLSVLIYKSGFSMEPFNVMNHLHTIKVQVIESFPLMGQEILEGSVFVVIINSIVSKIGLLELSTYIILNQFSRFLFVPMNMYGSATITLVSKNNSTKDYRNLKQIPFISSCISILLYILLGWIFVIFKKYLPAIITEDFAVIQNASSLMVFMVIANMFNPFNTIYKNALLGINESKFILFTTAAINAFTVVITLFFTYGLKLNLYGIFLGTLVNNLLLTYAFYKRYKKHMLKL